MNWKIILIGGVAFYATMFVISMGMGPLIHEGVLDELYKANAQFWRPELNQEPPDMAALMPRWITVGLVTSFIMAGVYGWIRSAYSGPGWQKGLMYGVTLFLISASVMAGYSGVFNLPDVIWGWWIAESALMYPAGGAVLGLVAEKLVPESA